MRNRPRCATSPATSAPGSICATPKSPSFTHAIQARGGIRNLHVRGNEIAACGAGGIYAGGEAALIENNHVHGIGRAYPSAIGIYRGGRDCIVRHNEVHDTSYTAINYGGERNLIARNLIHDCMKVLHDGAAIYLFAGKNCIVRGNVARDITDTGGYGASAYYLDERSEGCVVEGNLHARLKKYNHPPNQPLKRRGPLRPLSVTTHRQRTQRSSAVQRSNSPPSWRRFFCSNGRCKNPP